jgi:hypothetical protein
MPYIPPPLPPLVCPVCSADVMVIAKRRGWMEELDHAAPLVDGCEEAVQQLHALRG